MEEMDSTVAVVTETWLSDGPGLDEDLEMLEAGAGISMVTLNRERNNQGFSHGGVAIVYQTSQCTFKRIPLHNPNNFEVLAAAGKFSGFSRQILVIGAYIPPTYNAQRASGCLDFITDSVIAVSYTHLTLPTIYSV